MSDLLARLSKINPNLPADEVLYKVTQRKWGWSDFLDLPRDNRTYLLYEIDRGEYWGPDLRGYFGREMAGFYTYGEVRDLLRRMSRPERLIVELA